MSGTLQLERHMQVAFFQKGDTIAFDIERDKDRGTGLAKKIKIFRAGTFRDSMGIQHTWTREHLEQMVFHFNLLRDSGVLPNVPWRMDHSMSVKNIAGYFEKLYAEDGFLFADVNFTEPDVLDGMERGTYRSRSLEVGVYETNDEAFYWPVVTGCAFVDLPAVEGLYSQVKPVNRTVLYQDARSANGMFKINGKEVTEAEWLAAANYAKALEDLGAVPAADLAAAQQRATEAEQRAAAAANHSRGETATFMIAGQPSQDVVAVQNHITTLETFRSESVKAAKTAFVKQLVTDKKLAATQLDSQTEFVENLTDEQFAAYKKSWDAAPAASLFGNHGAGPADNPPAGGGGGASHTEIETLEEIVSMHRRSGMAQEQIEKTDSFKKLTALRAAAK